jgi:serine/threonine protein kinase
MFQNKQNIQNVKFGGNILFDEFALPDTDIPGRNKLIKSKTDPVTGKLTFETFDSKANYFTNRQLKSLRILINFVLPNMTFNGQKLGKEFITNVETMGAGNFGITIYYKDIIIKVLHTGVGVITEDIIREIDILENLFRDGANPPPPTMNKYYGFMSGKNIEGLRIRNTFISTDGKIKLYSDLFSGRPPYVYSNIGEYFSIDHDNILANIKQTLSYNEIQNFDDKKLNYMKNNFLDDIVLLFLDKEDGDLVSYINNIVPTLDNNAKVRMAKKLLVDIDSAFNFMHKIKHVMHVDVKPQNIVYKMGADGIPLFKLIDFGAVVPINAIGLARHFRTFTSIYFKETRHSANNSKSYMYDKWCLLNCALNILGVSMMDVRTVLKMSEIATLTSMVHITDIHAGLNNFYNTMVTTFRLNLAPLKVPVSNYGFFALIYNLLATNNIPEGIPPLK